MTGKRCIGANCLFPLAFFVLLLALGLWLAQPAQAATINVGCDVNQLVNAINTANASPDADTLELSLGCTYTLINVNNSDSTLGPNGLPIITSEITLNGNDATITRDGAAPKFRFLQIDSAVTLTLDQLTLTGGLTSDGTNGDKFAPGEKGGDGGAIYNNGTLIATNVLFRGNATGAGGKSYQDGGNGGDGGAVYNTGNLTLTDCTLEENRTGMGGEAGNQGKSGSGGAIFNEKTAIVNVSNSRMLDNRTADGSPGGGIGSIGNGGAIQNEGTATLTNGTFSGNFTGNSSPGFEGGNGGGIANFGTLTLTDGKFTDNHARFGGALYSEDTLISTHNTLSENQAAHGGGIANYGATRSSDDTLNANMAADGGGGIFNDGTLDLFRANLSGNWARSNSFGLGGGIYNLGTLTTSATTFAGNIAAADRGPSEGGGIYNRGALEVTNSTFSANVATTGAGIFNYGTLALMNSTIVANNADWVGGIDGGGTLKNTIVANNSGMANCSVGFDDGGGNMRWPKKDTSCVGIAANPKLGALQDNGGPTQTMALALDSPAINAAVDENCPATDQRGIARPQGKRCDIGAFELQTPTRPTLRAPVDGETITRPRVNLMWKAAARAGTYQVLVRQDTAKGKKIVNLKVTTTNFTTPVLASAHWYYWRVKACSRAGCTASVWWKFHVN